MRGCVHCREKQKAGKSIEQELQVSLLTFMRGMEKGACSFMSFPPEDPFYFLDYWSARWVGEGNGLEEEKGFRGSGKMVSGAQEKISEFFLKCGMI